jgi:hypothetical protein
MSGYSQERDVDNSFLSSEVFNNNPLFDNFWRNNPLDSDSLIDPRRAGFRPYVQYSVVSNNEAFMPSCAVYQTECSVIKPVNRCYTENPQEWIADLFRGR